VCLTRVALTELETVVNDSLKEGIPVRFVVGSFLEKAMLASCPAVAMPNI
jgi:hypothetical protein